MQWQCQREDVRFQIEPLQVCVVTYVREQAGRFAENAKHNAYVSWQNIILDAKNQLSVYLPGP